jgi:hypothetical protein
MGSSNDLLCHILPLNLSRVMIVFFLEWEGWSGVCVCACVLSSLLHVYFCGL